MIRGRFMEVPSWRGRVGIRIPESGMAARTSPSDPDSESVSSEVLDGDGPIGDLTGTTATPCITTIGTTPGAIRFTTGAISIEEQAGAPDSTAHAAESTVAPTQGMGTLTGTSARAVEFLIGPLQRIGLSTETRRLLEAMPHPGDRAVSGL